MRFVIRGTVLLLAAVFAWPQSSATPTAKFEVATIKRCTTDPGHNGGEASRGRITINCFSVTNLITRTYVLFANGKRNPIDHDPVPIEGGPAWADSDRYTIVAKAEGTPTLAVMSGPMMQALLEDRFRLRIHRRTTEIPVYALSVAKGRPRLAVAKEACVIEDMDHPLPQRASGQHLPPICDRPSYSDHGLDMPGATLEQFGRALHSRLGRPVVDKTGIAGHFDFQLAFPPKSEVDSPVSRMEASFDGVQAALSRLGLKVGVRERFRRGNRHRSPGKTQRELADKT